MFCAYCRAENPDDASWCVQCARDLSAQRTPVAHTPAPAGAFGDSLDGLGTIRTPENDGGGALSEGHLIAGRWRVEGFLGRGGMGEVYRVFDTATDRRLALKRVHPRLTSSASARQRFMREAAIGQELTHPHIVRTYDVRPDGESQLFTMELVDGGSLRAALERQADAEGTAIDQGISLERALEIVDQILAALEYAHRFTIHRDVKPENVLLTSKGAVKLADFGIAKIFDLARLTSTTQALGTPYYMAPEQLDANARVDARADLYGVGAVLYELLTGKVPAGRFKLPSELRPGLPADLDAFVEKALDPDPEQRFADAAAMRSALAAVRKELERKRKDEELRRQRATAERKKREAEEKARAEQSARAAAARHQRPAAAATPPKESPTQPVAPPPGRTRSFAVFGSEPRARSPFAVPAAVLLGGLVVIVGLVLLSGLFLSFDGGRARTGEARERVTAPQTPGVATQRPTPSSSAEANRQARISALLEEAGEQFQSRNVTIPAGANALETYREVLRLDPGNTAAQAGLDKIRDFFVERARIQEVAKDWADAKEELEKALLATPDDAAVTSQLQRVETRLGRSPAPSAAGPQEMVLVPAGNFLMGSNDGNGDERPVHEVYLDAYWIDRTEVTVDAYRKCVDAGRCSDDGLAEHGSCTWARPGRGDHPVNCVDWNQANAYCSWARKRLPTEAEWEKAARGTDGREFAWGVGLPSPGRRFANVADEAAKRAHPSWTILDGYDDGYAETAPVGSFPAGASPYGALDMTGNVVEWVSDWYGRRYYSFSPSRNPKGPSPGSSRVLRGGSWLSVPSVLRASSRVVFGPGVGAASNGFRCARDG